MGKLRTAIKILLLLAFDAMADSKVKEVENPKEVNRSVAKNSKVFSMGLLKNKENSTNPSSDNMEQNKKL